MEELIRLGAYRKGSDPNVDEAIAIYPKIEAFLSQNKDERTSIDEGFAVLADIVGMIDETDPQQEALDDLGAGFERHE